MYDIALVGSGGFLGGAISRILESRGFGVSPFTRSSPILVEGPLLAPQAADCRVVVWAAGALSPAVAHQHPELVDAELAQFAAAVDAFTLQRQPPRVLLLSSGGTVYGEVGAPPFRESDTLSPANRYGDYKLAQEGILAAAGLDHVILRVANAYGPGQRGARGQGVLAIWMQSVLDGDPIRIHGSGDVARDYVYVDDVAEAVARVIETPNAPSILNIGSGQPTTLDELADLLRRVIGEERTQVERLPSRGIDAASTWLEISLARQSLRWSPATGLGNGIQRMWHWIESL